MREVSGWAQGLASKKGFLGLRQENSLSSPWEFCPSSREKLAPPGGEKREGV